MDSLRSEFLAVEKRWMRVNGESEEWGKLLESIHPEMETFQVTNTPRELDLFINSLSLSLSLSLDIVC